MIQMRAKGSISNTVRSVSIFGVIVMLMVLLFIFLIKILMSAFTHEKLLVVFVDFYSNFSMYYISIIAVLILIYVLSFKFNPMSKFKFRKDTPYIAKETLKASAILYTDEGFDMELYVETDSSSVRTFLDIMNKDSTDYEYNIDSISYDMLGVSISAKLKDLKSEMEEY